MPCIGFTCPEGENIKHEDCLAKCRLGRRCATRPTLRLLAVQRPWTGKPSVTQCLSGTMEAFLKITQDYYESVDGQAFRLAGTIHHGLLENFAVSELAEEKFKEDISGIPDLLEVSEDDPDMYDLYDYKNSGSFMVAKALGLYKEAVVVRDDQGDPVVYKSGKKAGEQKTRQEVRQSDDKIDMTDWCLQINRYRIFFESSGFPVKNMRLQVTVRDGGIAIAAGRGVERNIYILDIPRMDDAEILEYFKAKAEALLKALAAKRCDAICSKEERWDDRKCQSFCSVASLCSYGRPVKAHYEAEKEGK